MLLVQLTVNGVVKYLSDDWHDIEHFYEGYISSLSELRIATRQFTGGFYEPSYGSIEFLVSAFAGNFPPPVQCPIKIGSAITNESNYTSAIVGTAYLKSVSATRVVYDIYGGISEYMVTDAVYSGTLLSIFQSEIPKLGYTLNYGDAAAVQPMVDYKVDGESNLLDNLSDIAAFFCHRFHLSGSVIYLISCLKDFNTLHVDEFSSFAGEPVTSNSPYKKYVCKYTPDVKKYRLTFSETQDTASAYVAFSELEMFKETEEKKEAKDLLTETAKLSVSSQPDSTHSKDRLIDNNNATQWACVANDIPCWVQYDFTDVTVVDSYTITARAVEANLGQSPIKWDLKCYSEEESKWVKIQDYEADPDWEVSDKRTFSVGELSWDLEIVSPYTFSHDTLDISPVCHTDYANIRTAMLDIQTMYELMRVQLIMPLGTGGIHVGGRIELFSESMMEDSTIWCRVSSITWDFNSEKVVVEGEGGFV